MEVFNLNIRPGKACPVLHCSQFDKGRMFRANLFDGAEVFTLTGSETLSIIEKKTDGNMVTIGVANTSDSYVVFGTTEQMTALAGCQLCELRIVDGEDLIGSLNFLLDCEESPDTGIESESAIHNLQEQIGEAVAEQYSGEDVIFDPTPTAGHGVGFAVTSEGVKTELDKKADTDDLAPVATSGNYNDLDNLPTIPENLPELGDVEITSPTAGQIIGYDPNDGKWKNVANPASTTNFGAPYDENTTYNVPSLVIENNLLYKLNEDEVDVTGPFDPTKWTQTSVAELTTDLIGAVNEVDEKATSEVIPLNIAQGVTVAYASVSKNDKLVTITAEVRFSGSANAWTNLATIAFPPRVVQLSVPAVNSANGSLMGILQVQSSGNIRIYPTTAQSNGACAFSISYLTA